MRLQIEALWDECFTDNDIRAALENLPKDLDSTYRRCLERIERNGDTNHALRVFQWVGCASRSLHSTEIQEAIAFTTMDRRWESGRTQNAKSIVGRCANLVVLDVVDQHVRFAHPSVLQYIMKRSDRDHAFQVDYKQGLVKCAEFSINYLNFSNFGPPLQKTDRNYDKVVNNVLVSTTRLGKMMTKLARHRPRATANSTLVNSSSVTRLGPAPGDTRFNFLSYAAENWANDSKFITKQSCMWDDFRSLALKPSTSWKLHPWPSDGVSYQSHLHGLLTWAVRKRHLPLLDILIQSNLEFKTHELCRKPLVEDGLPALHAASKLGYDDVVTLLLDVADVNTLDYLQRTALDHAAEKGHSKVTRILSKAKGIRANGISNSLITAAKQGHVTIVQLLLEAGAKVKARDREQRTALSWAAGNGHAAVMNLLLDRTGIDINAKDHYDQTPCFWAAQAGREEVLELLLTRDSIDVNILTKNGESLLGVAIENGHEIAVKLLLRRNDLVVNLSAFSTMETPLFRAVRRNSEVMVKLLLARGDVNVKCSDNSSQTPLMKAILNQNERITKLLLDHNDIDVNSKDREGRTALHQATDDRCEWATRMLLGKKDIQVNAADNLGRTPLHWTIVKEDGITSNLLLDRDDINVNLADDGGQTLLHLAIKYNNNAMVRSLLQRDEINVNLADRDGQTPLHWAYDRENEIAMKLLLQRDEVDVNLTDGKDRTPLHIAVRHKNDIGIKLLLQRDDINVNLDDRRGQTPLHFAVEYKNDVMIKLLLQRDDIDVNLADRLRQTPLFVAVDLREVEIIKLFLSSRDDFNINAKDEQGLTPLSCAVIGKRNANLPWQREEYDEIYRMMLSYNQK